MNMELSLEEMMERVKQYQAANGFTDQRMAELIGCSRPVYNRTIHKKMKAGKTFYNGAARLLASGNISGGKRVAAVRRETGETSIEVEIDIDGTGQYEINTGISMFDHLLTQLARHGAFDIKLKASGDDQHHVAEDVGICLGQAFNKALGEKRGIVRMANFAVPMDEALAEVVIDISGRGYTVLDMTFEGNDMFGFATDLIRHFLESFAAEARLNLHARVAYGSNDHHKAEAVFKALARALDMATRIDERLGGVLPSTKGFLEG